MRGAVAIACHSGNLAWLGEIPGNFDFTIHKGM